MFDGFVSVATRAPRVRVADVGSNLEACVAAAREAAGQGAKVVVLSQLCLTGCTCGDLFGQDILLDVAEEAVLSFAQQTEDLDALLLVGAPLRVVGKLYNCAIAVCHGELLGIVPQQAVDAVGPFQPGPEEVSLVPFGEDYVLPFGANQLFACDSLPELVVAVELGADLLVPCAPSVAHALAGATLIANLAAAPEIVGKAARDRALVTLQSAQLLCAYASASAGAGESTTDGVYAGQCLIAEAGTLLAQAEPFGAQAALTQVDVDLLASERRRQDSFAPADDAADGYWVSDFDLELEECHLTREVDPHPFTPQDPAERAERCEAILNIQAHGLAERMGAIGSKRAVIGISGGLDSTLALLVTARAFDLLGLERSGILAITMPGFGTTDRTHNNAWQLSESLGAEVREIAIGASVRQHFADIGHDETVRNAAYENAQARERTQILMDVANDIGGLVVGTGDLSELALGWATYNGDHMSMYGVNGGVPKTLVRHLVRHVANTCGDEREAQVLLDVLDTPVSPELLPANEDGTIAQQTEDLVGPYELHDFFVYQMLRYGMRPRKVLRLACEAFAGSYDEQTILKWLRVFYRRFFSQQFKRSCSPDGPAIGSVGLSPRTALRMPSDASSRLWLAELEEL